jgi:hypothetical protein
LDRERTLRCDLQAMRLFKQETGLSLLKGELTSEVIQGDMETLVPTLLWAFLKHEDADLTVDHVASLLHPGTFLLVTEAVMGLVEDAMPEAEEKAEGEEDPQAASSTKKTSGS